jgi:hypothetical protein
MKTLSAVTMVWVTLAVVSFVALATKDSVGFGPVYLWLGFNVLMGIGLLIWAASLLTVDRTVRKNPVTWVVIGVAAIGALLPQLLPFVASLFN